jgi:hypothetical protein
LTLEDVLEMSIDNGNFLEHFLVELITIQQNNNSPYHVFWLEWAYQDDFIVHKFPWNSQSKKYDISPMIMIYSHHYQKKMCKVDR